MRTDLGNALIKALDEVNAILGPGHRTAIVAVSPEPDKSILVVGNVSEQFLIDRLSGLRDDPHKSRGVMSPDGFVPVKRDPPVG